MVAPFASEPVSTDLMRCQNSESDSPDSSELRDASMPRSARWLMEK